MFAWLATILRLHGIPRRGDLSDRATVLALGGRFTDEFLSGLPTLLMPTIRRRLGLDVADVGLLFQLLDTASGVVEPAAGLLIDVSDRRRLLTWGAVGWGLAVCLIALGGGLGWLAAAFVLIGLASGPLAHTADVVLVEAHPLAPDRISTRSTVLDTVGALLAPLSVAAASWAGVHWPVVLLAAGGAGLVYAALLAGTVFPPSTGRRGLGAAPRLVAGEVRDNIATVMRDSTARRWLGYLFLESLTDLAVLFQPIWLFDHAGMSQALIAVYVAAELAISLLGLLVLDRVLVRVPTRTVLLVACLGVTCVYPAWLLVPGVATKFALMVPLNLLAAPLWPLGRGLSLTSMPGRAGTVTALRSLFGLVPTAWLFAHLAGRFGLTAVMLTVRVAAGLGMLALVFRAATPDVTARSA